MRHWKLRIVKPIDLWLMLCSYWYSDPKCFFNYFVTFYLDLKFRLHSYLRFLNYGLRNFNTISNLSDSLQRQYLKRLLSWLNHLKASFRDWNLPRPSAIFSYVEHFLIENRTRQRERNIINVEAERGNRLRHCSKVWSIFSWYLSKPWLFRGRFAMHRL